MVFSPLAASYKTATICSSLNGPAFILCSSFFKYESQPAIGSYFGVQTKNALALGNCGTGKTHIALGLGLAACQKAHHVRFVAAASLVRELIEAKDEKRVLRY